VENAFQSLAEEDQSGLAALVRGFAPPTAEYRKLIRKMLEQDRDSFHAAAVEILKTPGDSKGYHYLISLLAGRDMLLEALSDPALTLDQAVAAARGASLVYSMMDVDMARRLAGDGFSPSQVAPDRAKRMMYILSEISKGTRALGALRSMVRHPDPFLRSKAVLMIGRGERNSGWAQHRLAEADPRVRANAVETLWGRHTEEARAVLQAATSDPHNRVVGNALLGLYRMGDLSAISGLFQMAGGEPELFRTSGAWAMGETADPRFAEVLGRMLGDPSDAVRKRAFESLRRIKKAVARSRQGPHLQVGGRLEAGPDGLRRLELEVARENGEPALVVPLEILLDEDGRPVVDYQVDRRPGAGPLTVVFVFPQAAGPVVSACYRGALNALRWKRPADVWWVVPYTTASDLGGSTVALNEAGVEMATDRAQAETLFDPARERVYFRGMWSAIQRALDPAVEAPGQRRIVVYSENEAGRPEARGDLPSAAGRCGASVSAVCQTPDPMLEDLCRSTEGDFRTAQTAAEFEALVEGAHRAVLDQYMVTYRSVAPEAATVRVRIYQPDGWGETLLAAPNPSLEAAVAKAAACRAPERAAPGNERAETELSTSM
jgi:HEAT repeat protein